jgi:hypothetical protein
VLRALPVHESLCEDGAHSKPRALLHGVLRFDARKDLVAHEDGHQHYEAVRGLAVAEEEPQGEQHSGGDFDDGHFAHGVRLHQSAMWPETSQEGFGGAGVGAGDVEQAASARAAARITRARFMDGFLLGWWRHCAARGGIV